jgi:hypothetical protein
MRVILFEGTQAEFAEVKQHFAHALAIPVAAEPKFRESEAKSISPETLSSEKICDVIVDLFTRRPLPESMVQIFEALFKDREGLSSRRLIEMLGITSSQFAGVMGAFGRRISHTEGWPENLQLAENYWVQGERHYRLTPIMVELLRNGRVKLRGS